MPKPSPVLTVWLIVLPVTAAAQHLPPEVQRAVPVRLWLGQGHTTGLVQSIVADRTSMSVDTCPLRVNRTCSETFRLDALERIDIGVGNRAVEGAGIGLLLAVTAGVLVATTQSGRSDLDGTTLLTAYTAITAVVTVPLGLIFGAGTRRWRTVYPPPTRDGPAAGH